MKKNKTVAIEKSAPIYEKLEQLSKIKRIAIWASVMVLLVGGFIYFAYVPKYTKIDRLNTNLKKVEKELQVAKKNARQLSEYRKKMQDAEEQFKIVMRALPEKEEIPTLLTGISKSGKDSGLNFVLFQPKPDIEKEFYAEIPVAIEVSGDYHGVATFFESVAGLNRIVNIRDIMMTPDKESGILNTSCTAVTYKFIEPSEKPETKSKSRHRRTKNR